MCTVQQELNVKNYLNKLGFIKDPYYSYDQIASSLYGLETLFQSHKAFVMFIAQSAYETAGYTAFVENLNYTKADRIVAVWPSRFYVGSPVAGKRNASNYTRNPQALANVVYANRNGNGSEFSGDGYRYRGRGAFHLTFKDNYLACSVALFNDSRLVSHPELVEQCRYAFQTAYWFWSAKNLTPLAEANNFREVTKRINGSTATVKAREKYWTLAKNIFV